MNEVNNIWNDNKGGLPEDKLMAYLEGRLSPEEQHEVEQWLAEEGMESDALEGLQSLPASETRHTVDKLNHELRKTISTKKSNRRQIRETPWSWLAIALILLLAVLAYMVIRFSLKK